MTSSPSHQALTLIHRGASRARWVLALGAAWAWFVLLPPTSDTEIYIGMAVLVMGHRALAPAAVRARRRATLRPRMLIGVVAGILFGVAAPQAWAVPLSDIQPDLCRIAPTAETTGGGLTGFLDPQQDLPMDGTPYGDRGFAGTFWVTYDTGCATAGSGLVLDQFGVGAVGRFTADMTTNAGQDTQVGNMLLSAAKTGLAFGTGMRARANDPQQFAGLDSIMAQGVQGLRDLLINPWMGIPLLLLGCYLIVLSRKGDVSQTLYRTVVTLASLGLIAVLGEQPLAMAAWADQQVVALRQSFDEGYVNLLPDDLIPITQWCDYDLTQFDRPPVWDPAGQLVVEGTPCTPNVRPSLNPEHQWTDDGSGVLRQYNPAYFSEGEFYAEVMYSNLIFPAWQEGIIGTRDRSGPNYDLAMLFLRGQSLTTFDLASSRWRNDAENNAPVGAVWCTFVDNKQTCGVSDSFGPPGRLIDNAEADYMAAIELAGDERYPFIQGKAGNRTSAGATALASVAAAVPFPAAADTGVWVARLLLRVGVIACIVLAFAMILVPSLLRYLRRALTTAVTLLLLLSGVGALMTWMTLQLISNPAVYGYLGYQGGLFILAGITVVLWIFVRPMRRIGGMLSTTLTNDPNALSNMRKGATKKLTSPLRRGADMIRHRRLRKAVGRAGQGQGSGDTGDHGYDDDSYADEEVFEGPRPESTAAAAGAAGSGRPGRPVQESTSRPEQGGRQGAAGYARDDPRAHMDALRTHLTDADRHPAPGSGSPWQGGPRSVPHDAPTERYTVPRFKPGWDDTGSFDRIPSTDDGWEWWNDPNPNRGSQYTGTVATTDEVIDAEIVEPVRHEIFRPEPAFVTARPRALPAPRPLEIEYEIFRPRPELPPAPVALAIAGPVPMPSESGATQ